MNEDNDRSLTKNTELIEYPAELDKLNQWTIPSVKPEKIYNMGFLNLKARFAVKTTEQTIQIADTTQTIKLLNKRDLMSHFSNYKFIHIGLIQIALKPLTLLGHNASIMAHVRDGRCKDFKQSLAAVIETSLCHGPVYFDVSPNLTLSLTDKNILDAMILTVQTNGYNFKPGSEIMAICYRIYYKVLQTLTPNAKLVSFPGTTTLVQTNLLTSRIATNRLIKWEEINFPEIWNQPQEIDPQPILNKEIDQIIQTTEGDIEIKFTPQYISRSLSMRSHNRNQNLIPNRASTSTNYPEEVEYSDTVETIRLSSNQVPHGIYQRNSPSRSSPTPSDMSFN